MRVPMFWANSNSSARATHSLVGPQRKEFRLTALPMSAKYVGPHNSLVCWPIVCLMGQRSTRAYITAHEMGPCKCLGAIASSMFWANPNSLARATHSHGGPRQEFRLTALPMSLCGPTQQSRILAHCVLGGPTRAYITVHEMGPCECLGAIASAMFWANSNSSARATHSYGGPRQEFRLTALPMSPNYVGPHNSLACWPVV
jgi:hypothetical protein